MQQALRNNRVSRGKLWFGTLGGGLAWTAHLFLAYALAEFGCLSALGRVTLLGISGVAWSVLGVTIPLALVAAAAAWVGWKMDERLRGETEVDRETEDVRLYMARTGWISSGLFLFVILFETVPVFYFLQHC